MSCCCSCINCVRVGYFKTINTVLRRPRQNICWNNKEKKLVAEKFIPKTITSISELFETTLPTYIITVPCSPNLNLFTPHFIELL